MNEARRPRDLALLLLASEGEPPRQRARDQRADIAGLALRRVILHRLAMIDPEPDGLDAAIELVVAEAEFSGPTRASALMFREEWGQAREQSGLWDYLLAEAIEKGERS